MADLSGVETALVSTLAAGLFSSAYLPGAYQTSTAGISTKVYRGWPEAANLDAGLKNGAAHVSVFPESGMTRLTTRFRPEWFIPLASVPTVTATVSGSAVTIGGVVGAAQVVSITIGTGNSATYYPFRIWGVAPGEGYSQGGVWYGTLGAYATTLEALAASLTSAIPGATLSGRVITIPTTLTVTANVLMDATALREVRRQEQGFRISVWAPNPLARDSLCSLVDQAIAGLVNANGEPTEFVTLANGETMRVRYRSTTVNDAPSKDRLWRRDICVTVEYATTVSQLFPLAGAINVSLNGNGAVTSFGAVNPQAMVLFDGANVFLDAGGNLVGVVQ